MMTFRIDSIAAPMPPCVATIGFFDGVHRGHQFLIGQVVAEARRTGMASMAITFDQHPRQVLHQDYVPTLLSTLEGKLQRLSETQIDSCGLLHFDRNTAALSAEAFMATVLHDRLNVKTLIIGYDNRFGHDRSEGFADYVRYGERLGMEVRQAEAYDCDGLRISSSVVRRCLQEGDVATANQCLGYSYTIAAPVISGYHEGRQMGFPTANLDTARIGQLLPLGGVYATRVRIEGTSAWLPAMTNIGVRPTFDGEAVSVETNIVDFEGNVYGKRLEVAFIERIRDERRFDSEDALRRQLLLDRQQTQEILRQRL